MRKVWKRLWWNIRHLGSEQINPYVRAGEGDALPKERSALERPPSRAQERARRAMAKAEGLIAN
jgi:hypothetical protein